MPPKKKGSFCELCTHELKPSEDVLQCFGPCQALIHRYCAAVTASHYKKLQAAGQGGSPTHFTCLYCSQEASAEVTSRLQTEIDYLKQEVVEVTSRLQAEIDSLKQAFAPLTAAAAALGPTHNEINTSTNVWYQ